MLRTICEKLGFDSLGYQSLDGMLEGIGIDPSKSLHLLLDRQRIATFPELFKAPTPSGLFHAMQPASRFIKRKAYAP